MILADHELHASGERLVSPFKHSMVQPASIDLTLGRDFLEPIETAEIDLLDISESLGYIPWTGMTGFHLSAGHFVLGTTAEEVHIPDDMVGQIEGKSSLARLGLCVHVTAGFCDPGFKGRVTLELVNFSPSTIVLRPGKKICQIAFARLGSAAEKPYGSPGLGSHYQDQVTTTGSRYQG